MAEDDEERKSTCPGAQRSEADGFLSVRLLHAGSPDVLQHHLREILIGCVGVTLLGDVICQLGVLVHPERAVRRATRSQICILPIRSIRSLDRVLCRVCSDLRTHGCAHVDREVVR